MIDIKLNKKSYSLLVDLWCKEPTLYDLPFPLYSKFVKTGDHTKSGDDLYIVMYFLDDIYSNQSSCKYQIGYMERLKAALHNIGITINL